VSFENVASMVDLSDLSDEVVGVLLEWRKANEIEAKGCQRLKLVI